MAQGKLASNGILYNFNCNDNRISFVAYESVQVNQTQPNHGTAGGGVFRTSYK